ncbi:MAG: winged helix DNA-binding domain-containing protein [Sporichthyaceae bacterium]|nr:winged helix DNA-binding domain-containing protein [Sporichthyaceae bacterium]
MPPAVLSRRALNRATLDRQLLLRRASMPPLDLVDHLVGFQSQTPQTWYVGFWTRLVDCDPDANGALLTSRQLVRIALMSSTIHLVTAADALALRPLLQVVGERSLGSNFGKNLLGLDRESLTSAGRAVLDAKPMTFSQLGRELAKQWPGRDEASLAQAIRAWVPLVQVPPRGVWGASGMALHAPLESWVGEPVRDYPVDQMVLRYLAAFGPASVKDVQVWSGLTKLREVLDRLRDRLVVFQNEAGVELFDLPEAPRPDPDIEAPVRYLYDFDNLLLSHSDQSRVLTDTYTEQNWDFDGPMPRLFLVDGFTAGTWLTDVTRGATTLTIRPFRKLAGADAKALAAEGEGLLSFVAPKASTRAVRFEAPAG